MREPRNAICPTCMQVVNVLSSGRLSYHATATGVCPSTYGRPDARDPRALAAGEK